MKKMEHKLQTNSMVLYTLFTLDKILSFKLMPLIKPTVADSSVVVSIVSSMLLKIKLFLYSKYMHPLSSKFVKQKLLQVHNDRSHWILRGSSV